MKNNKMRRLYEVMMEGGSILNLHQIKALTGAGNGYTDLDTMTTAYTAETPSASSTESTKMEKIYAVVSNINGKANLHQIKAMTGAGNGYRQ